MRAKLLKQSIVVPLGALLVPIVIALTLPGYSSISQHVSELETLDHPVAFITRCASVVTGLSIFLFGLGAALSDSRKFVFTVVSSSLAGASMISNGVFVSGSPLHGLYGLALFAVLVPACFAAELGGSPRIVRISLAVAVLSMAYFWLQLSGFDPQGFRGLTQRIAMVVMFGWYAVAGQAMLRRVGG